MWSCIVPYPTAPVSSAIESKASSPENEESENSSKKSRPVNANPTAGARALTEDEVRSIASKYFGEILSGSEDKGDYWFICPLTISQKRCDETGVYIHKTTGAILPRLSSAKAQSISRKHFKLPEGASVFIETRGNYYFSSRPFRTFFNNENGIYIHKQTGNVLTSRPASLDPP